MSNYPINPIFKRLTAIGWILFAIGVTLVGTHTSLSVGPDLKNPVTIAGFVIAIIGWLVITFAWIGGMRLGWFPLEPKLGEPRLRQQRKFGWILSFGLAVLYGFWTWQSWEEAHASAFPIWIAVLWLPMLLFASGKRSLQRPLEAQGGYPQDEREQRILHTASFYAFYTAILILGLTAMLLYYAPAPSKFALDTLFLADIVMLFSIRDFIAWRMGLK